MKLEDITLNIIDGKAEEVEAGVKSALAEGVEAEAILNQALIPAMDEVGRRFECGDFFVPEMLIAARAMQTGLTVLKSHLVEAQVKSAGKVAMGTVKGDLHDIGKNLVAIMLEGAGFEVVDLGVDVAPEAFIEAANNGAQVIGMSALLTTTMDNMRRTVEALVNAGARGKVKIIVGGAPLTDEYAARIGADGFAPDAPSAARLVRQLILS